MLQVVLLVVALAIVAGVVVIVRRHPSGGPRAGGIAAAGTAVVFAVILLSSLRHVGADQVGVVTKNVGPKPLPAGSILAIDGETGPQAEVLGPGWHLWLWPVVYDVSIFPVVEIRDDEVGLLTTSDGEPLPAGAVFAPAWPEQDLSMMLDAVEFLKSGKGYKGPQTTVLTPGRYRLNPRLYTVDKVPVTNIAPATVAVIKSNVGELPVGVEDLERRGKVVDVGQRGIWREPFGPQKLYLNTEAYEVTAISTAKRVLDFAAGASDAKDSMERDITVRSSDGFTFPVDVRVEYQILPVDAPVVVAQLGNDREALRGPLNSAVRAIFRNNAERVKALDYVRGRSQQESQSLAALVGEMRKLGVTITAVRIGSVGDQASLGQLLKTQTDREIALQEQVTFQEQQRAAEQKKALSRTEQEAEEERRLATSQYEVKISEQEKQQRIIGAEGEAETIRIKAEAQAKAFEAIAAQVGSRNAAMLEMLRIVGMEDILITPRVMMSGHSPEAGGDSAALVGTMLDLMISREENAPVQAAAPAKP